MSMTYQLTNVGDVKFENGNFVPVVGVSALIDRIATRLRTFLGEWFLNTEIGVPYYQNILGQKNPNFGVLYAIFAKEIRDTVGVISLRRLSLDYEAGDRQLSITFSVQAEDGILEETLTFEV